MKTKSKSKTKEQNYIRVAFDLEPKDYDSINHYLDPEHKSEAPIRDYFEEILTNVLSRALVVESKVKELKNTIK